MRLLWIIILCSLFTAGNAADSMLTAPPSKLPVKVETSFYLLHLVAVREKDESFEADCYFKFVWEDLRLSFEDERPDAVQVFLDQAVEDKLKQIWWPQMEFLNAATPQITNRALFIYKTGHVEYIIGLTGSFRSVMRFHKFPFDAQHLKILVDSFIWNDQIVQFIPFQEKARNLGESQRNDLTILEITTQEIKTEGFWLENLGKSNKYSTFEITINMVRKTGFYFYQIFVPLLLIIGIACTIYYASRRDPFLDLINVNLAVFFVFLATKFTINADLPHVAYMTKIDEAFLLTYILIGVGVIMATIREVYSSPERRWPDKLYYHCRWAVPLLFFLTLLVLYFT